MRAIVLIESGLPWPSSRLFLYLRDCLDLRFP
jgi:hypothetical protein